MMFGTVLRFVVLAALAFSSAAAVALDKKIKPGEGMVFGYATLHVTGAARSYKLYLREVTTGKRVAVPLDSLRTADVNFHFAKSLKPGRYYFETAMSPQVEWENTITDKSQFFDVAENQAVYVGKWNLEFRPKGTRYDIAYPAHVARSILEKVKGIEEHQVRKGVLGGVNEPFDLHSTKIPDFRPKPAPADQSGDS